MDVTGVIVGVCVAAGVLLIVFIILRMSVYIVRQAEGIVIERLGKYHKVLTPGVNFVVPFLDQARSFTWRKTYIDVSGRIVDSTVTNTRIDLRESVFNFLRQEVYTKDTILVDVNSLMYYSIGDIKKAIYEVDDLQSAISNVAQTQLKEVFGNMTFSDALASQHLINEHMRRYFSKTFHKWGIRVERIELQDLKPKQSISEAMKAQMIAERSRRAEFIRAEGNKAAMTLTSEGTKIVKFNMGIAEQESTRKRSEGEAGATVELARAESAALSTIGEAILSAGCSQTEYMMAQRYMEMCRSTFGALASKRVYLPYDISGIGGIISGLSRTFGRNSAGATAGRKPTWSATAAALPAGSSAGAAAGSSSRALTSSDAHFGELN